MYSLRKGVSILALIAGLSTPALASNGLADFVDPCIHAHDEFRGQRDTILLQLDHAVADADRQPASPEYRALWMKAKKADLRSKFDELVAPSLKVAGVTDMDKYYDDWFTQLLSKMGDGEVDKLVTANFHQELKQLRLEERAQGTAQVQAAQSDLDHECKMDAGNQALRVTLGAVMAPIELTKRNLDIANREPTVIGKALAAPTGISLSDIGKHGLGGGPGSEVNKAGAAIAKVFHW